MSRGTVVLDRAVLLLLGVVVLVISAFLVVWGLGRLPSAPAEVDLAVLRQVPDHPWWPWVLAVGGTLAVLVGLRSLLAHSRRRRVRHVTMSAAPDRVDRVDRADRADGGAGTDGAARAGGQLRLDLPAVATAAAESLSRNRWVSHARGTVVVDHGRPVLEILVRVDAAADLEDLRASIDRTRATLAVVLPPGTAHLRVRLDVHRARVENPRVT